MTLIVRVRSRPRASSGGSAVRVGPLATGAGTGQAAVVATHGADIMYMYL